MVTGVVPHVGGPILPPCCPTVLIGMLPAARVTDMAVCVGPPDVIVLDQMMPGLTGIETARRLRGGGFDKPIVLFSAYVGPDLQTAVRELDLKPVSKVDTQAVIRIVDALGGALA